MDLRLKISSVLLKFITVILIFNVIYKIISSTSGQVFDYFRKLKKKNIIHVKLKANKKIKNHASKNPLLQVTKYLCFPFQGAVRFIKFPIFYTNCLFMTVFKQNDPYVFRLRKGTNIIRWKIYNFS